MKHESVYAALVIECYVLSARWSQGEKAPLCESASKTSTSTEQLQCQFGLRKTVQRKTLMLSSDSLQKGEMFC